MDDFRAAIFDMDGLLIDSERAIMRAWVAAARDEGFALSEADYLRTVGRSLRDSLDLLLEHFGSRPALDAVRARARETLAPGGRHAVFPLKPGVRRVLERLGERGVPCAVASSSAIAEIRRRLDAVDAAGFFDAFAGGDEVERAKPDPAVYRLAVARLGVPAQRCLAFEDSDHGMAAAVAAGMRVVVVPDLKAPTETVRARAWRLVDSMERVLPHVEGWFPDATPPAPRASPGFPGAKP